MSKLETGNMDFFHSECLAMNGKLILASASPRRRTILTGMGLTFGTVTPEVDEVHWDESPHATVRENALRKCRWCVAQCPGSTVVAADTVVVSDGRTTLKPESMEQAFAFLRGFSGKEQSVLTGVALSRPGKATDIRVVESRVKFKALTDDIINNYFSVVDPLDKAGGYDIDQYGDLIIDGFEGSRTNIMGLPEEMLSRMLNGES